MEPVYIDGMNAEYAKNQTEYLNLPAYKDEDGIVTSCWKLSFLERLRLLFVPKIYVSQMTFNRPLQPQKVSTENPIVAD